MNSSDQIRDLFLQIEDFYTLFSAGQLHYPFDFAKELQSLADQAWDIVDELVQPSLRIDP